MSAMSLMRRAAAGMPCGHRTWEDRSDEPVLLAALQNGSGDESAVMRTRPPGRVWAGRAGVDDAVMAAAEDCGITPLLGLMEPFSSGATRCGPDLTRDEAGGV